MLHDIGKSISEYNWLFRIMAELKLVTNRKAFDYLNHEDIGYTIKRKINDPDISKYYFDNLLTEKNEILDKTDFYRNYFLVDTLKSLLTTIQ